MTDIIITDKTLSRIVSRVADAARSGRDPSQSSLLNIAAAEIAGPGHDWGFVKHGHAAPGVAKAIGAEAVGHGPVIVSCEFSLCDLPENFFEGGADEASGFLSGISSRLIEAMATAGNNVISDELENEFGDQVHVDEWDHFDHPAYRARECLIGRADGSFMREVRDASGLSVTWVKDRSMATPVSQHKAFALPFERGSFIVPIGHEEPENEPDISGPEA